MVLASLCILLLVSNGAWMYWTHVLTNKLMSRDFAHYQQVANPKPPLVREERKKPVPNTDIAVLNNIFRG